MLHYFRIFLSYFKYEFSTKRKDIIIFSGYNNLKYNFNSKYLFEYFLQNKSDLKLYFIINDDETRNVLNKTIGSYFITTKKKADLKLIFSAFTWISSGGLPVRIPYVNRNRVVINLWHGLPFKGIGLLNGENTFIQNIFIRLIYSKYDMVSSTSELFQQIMARSFGVNISKVVMLGQAWNDQLWTLNDKYQILNELFSNKLPFFEKVFLYAPTWRNGRNTQFFPFVDFSIDELELFLENHNFLICLRTHQLDLHNIKKYASCKRVLILNEDKIIDIMSILNIFDGLISDYSGIIFDYLLLDRPIILIPYDKAKYIAERNINFDFQLFEFLDSPNDLNSFLNSLLVVKNNFIPTEKQKRFKSIVHFHCDNFSCKRHFDKIIKLIEIKYKI